MKNIEKIAIDTLIGQFNEKNTELIQNAVSAKQAAEMASANFKKAAGLVLNNVKEISSMLLAEGVSEEALTYFEEKVGEITKLPFKAKQ